jgi:arylsulfatase A-like enzyme
VSLFTMAQPDEHGMVANLAAGRRRFVPSPDLVPFAAYAASLGMKTAAFVSAAPLKRQSGVDSGFAEFDEPRGGERRADATTEAALAWLGSPAARGPFLLWVHYFDAHSPYAPPPGYVERFAEHGRLREELSRRGVPERLSVPGHLPSRQGMATDAAENVTRYDAEIAFMDEQIGRLLGALRARSRWSRTAVVVAGDHGESLGQHGKLGHGEVWHEQLSAPLLMRVPGRGPARIGTLITTVDVLPTLLALVPLPGADAWLAQASGRNALDGAADRAILSRSTEKRRVRYGEPVLRALTTERWKYVRSEDGRQSLYDLAADPHERADVAAQHPDLLASFGERMSRELASLRERSAAEVGAPIDPALLEELRALGYVDDEPGADAPR